MTALADIAARLVEAAKAAGAEAADAIAVSGETLSVSVAARALEEAERSEGVDIGLRALVGRRQACVSASDIRPETISELAERAVAMALAAPEDPYCGLADPSEIATGWDLAALDLDDPADPPAPDRLEEIARAAEDAALSVGGVTQVERASAQRGRTELALAASNGFSGTYSRTSGGVSVSAIAGTGLRRERDWAYESRCHWADLPAAEEIGRRAAERAVAALGARRPPKGAVPVLYDERIASSLIGHLVGAANGSSVARGASWLRGRMGERVLPAGIDLLEDPLKPRGLASRPFDGEGVAARQRPIVEDGVLARWVLDLSSARQLGLATTGNARRGTGSPPSPGTSNLSLTQGSRSREELIREMGTGLIVTSMIGASVNPTTGAYSRGASGFWVENGEIAYPVNEITVAGSLPEMLARIVPANDADPAKSVSVPSLLVEGLTLAA